MDEGNLSLHQAHWVTQISRLVVFAEIILLKQLSNSCLQFLGCRGLLSKAVMNIVLVELFQIPCQVPLNNCRACLAEVNQTFFRLRRFMEQTQLCFRAALVQLYIFYAQQLVANNFSYSPRNLDIKFTEEACYTREAACFNAIVKEARLRGRTVQATMRIFSWRK